MCYLIIKVRNAQGKEINAWLKVEETLENEQELRSLAEGFNELLSECGEESLEYYKCTTEIRLNDETLVQQKDTNVPSELSDKLRMLLYRVQGFCDEQREIALGESADESRGLNKTPAFFKGEIYEVIG